MANESKEVKSAVAEKQTDKVTTLSASELSELISNITEKTAIAVAAAMRQSAKQEKAEDAAVLAARLDRSFGDRCHICGQYAKACGGKEEDHTEMVVYPTRYPEFGDHFRGYILNGVTWLSNNETHKLFVPTRCVPAISTAILDYEQNERETRHGRSKQHNSGNIRSPMPITDGNVGALGFR